jgi:hypoxanthine phosphoribosyltransferase
VRIKSYENTESTGKVNIMCESLHLLEGKDVLIVEDIIDTGTTLTRFCKQLQELKPQSIRVASLVEKRTPKSNGFVADFAGFSVPDEFLVGYCLDYNEVYRDLDHICTLGETGIKKYAK